MEALTKALEDLKAAEARYHDLLDPAGHMAKATQVLAVATAETVLASITGLSERITKLEAVHAVPVPPAPPQPEEPSAAAPDSAPAAPVPQEAAPAAEAPDANAGDAR